MDHYVDIRVLPDPEFVESVLMNALFAKFHRALAAQGAGDIGVSFPKAEQQLGNVLRLHGDAASLEGLMQSGWLKGLRDYTAVSEIEAVPDTCQFRQVKRVQTKSNAERLRRRSVKNGKLSEDEAARKIPRSKEKRLNLPYLELKSSSTGQAFKLFVQQSEPQAEAVSGRFSSYGLSSTATVPSF